MKRVEDVLYGLQVNTASGQRRAMSLGSFGVIVCLLAAPHLGFWVVKNPHATAPSVEEKLPSVSYNRFADSSSNDSKISEARIRADLTAIAARARAIRTYSSTRGLEQVPEIAAELGLNVTLGVWIDKNNARNERRFRLRFNWPTAIPMSPDWSWATKRCSAMNRPQPVSPKSSAV